MRAVRATLATCLVAAAPALAQERFAIVVAGAGGGAEYVQRYNTLTERLAATLSRRMALPESHVWLLSDTDRQHAAATAVNVRRVFGAVRGSMKPADLLLVVLIGHGTFDGVDAKFNLVGPDLEAAEWAALLKPIPGRVVVVNTTAGSFPFLERLASGRRIVITATDSPAQRFDTQFADHFITALADEAADVDKNGRVSMWEAFVAASGAVRRHYQQRGQLATERPLLDDSGDGIGSEAGSPGEDGALASRTYLDTASAADPPTDDVLVKLLQRRSVLESEVDDLKVRRTFMPPSDYQREFERIMVELARVSHQIRIRRQVP